MYLRARYYDPEIGRFISQDAVKDGYNWYVYCNGNPLLYVDPSGFAPGDLQVNGQNIGNTKESDGLMYGKISDFATAVGGSFSYSSLFGKSHVVRVGDYCFKIKDSDFILGDSKNINIYKGSILSSEIVGSISVTQVDSRRGSIYVADLQKLVDLSGNDVNSLAYDLGDKGGIYTKKGFVTTSIAFAPKTEAYALWESKAYAGASVWLSPYGDEKTKAGKEAIANLTYIAGLDIIRNTKDPFVPIEKQSWFLSGTSTVTKYTGTGSIYTLPDKNIGTFKYGVYK